MQVSITIEGEPSAILTATADLCSADGGTFPTTIDLNTLVTSGPNQWYRRVARCSRNAFSFNNY
ncbi:MAG: hypothetical protein H6554_04060 [Chitinophagales bacterium]|nr:hypothetical protein [Chitinophagales bacterium]